MIHVLVMAVLAAAADDGCPATTLLPGVEDPFRAPDATAMSLNLEASKLYRAARWDEARAKYRAALASDPEYLPPLLNLACSLVRQERFGEATNEAVALIRRGYVPWMRDVLSATDLGALKVRPEMKQIRQEMACAARVWATGLGDDLVFVARLNPALKIPPEGVQILAPQQEVFAFSPATARYRQLTAEDGRVLAIARSSNRRLLVYATAAKLVSPTAGPRVLRGAAVRVLDLGTMTLGETAQIDGDVRQMEIFFRGTAATVRMDRGNGPEMFVVNEGGQLSATPATKAPPDATVLGPNGVTARRAPEPLSAAVPGIARDRAPAGKPPTVEIVIRGRAPFPLRTRFGAGLRGLPLDPPAAPAASK